MANNEVAAMQEQIRNLKRELSIRPIRVPTRGGGSAAVPSNKYVLQISDAGQVVYTTPSTRGILYSATALTALPSSAPTAGSTYSNGIGGGYLLNQDGTLGSLVWVINRPITIGADTYLPGMNIPVPENCIILSLVKVSTPVTGGGVADAYQPFLT